MGRGRKRVKTMELTEAGKWEEVEESISCSEDESAEKEALPTERWGKLTEVGSELGVFKADEDVKALPAGAGRVASGILAPSKRSRPRNSKDGDSEEEDEVAPWAWVNDAKNSSEGPASDTTGPTSDTGAKSPGQLPAPLAPGVVGGPGLAPAPLTPGVVGGPALTPAPLAPGVIASPGPIPAPLAPAVRVPSFAGSWSKGFISQDLSTLTRNDGVSVPISVENNFMTLEVESKIFVGVLESNRIIWDNGSVWERLHF